MEEKEMWVPRDPEWIKNNPGKGTMHKVRVGDVEEIPTLSKNDFIGNIKKGYKAKDPGVYVIICESAKAVYVGQSVDVGTRLRGHRSILLKRNSLSKAYERMFVDVNKYGINSFSFDKYLSLDKKDIPLLDDKEHEAMHEFISMGYRLYNTYVPMSKDAIYCPEHMKDVFAKIIRRCIDDSTYFDSIKSKIEKSLK